MMMQQGPLYQNRPGGQMRYLDQLRRRPRPLLDRSFCTYYSTPPNLFGVAKTFSSCMEVADSQPSSSST